ncbi:MAG TPA: hypothetical protein VF589_13180 [Allosphingosinicella sp.]|jgi:hypothetical protein
MAIVKSSLSLIRYPRLSAAADRGGADARAFAAEGADRPADI